MSTEQAEKYAESRCLEIQKRRDMGLPPYSIKEAIVRDFLAGQQSLWRKYPAEKPEHLDVYLIMMRDELAECSYPMTAIWDKEDWDFTGDSVPPQHTVTHWQPINLPKQESES